MLHLSLLRYPDGVSEAKQLLLAAQQFLQRQNEVVDLQSWGQGVRVCVYWLLSQF